MNRINDNEPGVHDLDLNQLVSDFINKKTAELNDSVESLNDIIKEKNIVISKQKKDLDIAVSTNKISTLVKAQYGRLNMYEDGTLQINKKYLFIKNFMESIFDVKPFRNSYSNKNSLGLTLIYNYYHFKDLLIELLDFVGESENLKFFIKNYTFPCDFNKNEIYDFVKKPYPSNRELTAGLSDTWDGSKADIPYPLYFENQYILDDDVFDTIINGLSTFNLSRDFFYIYEHNSAISGEQIKRMGNTLLVYKNSLSIPSDLTNFIDDNMEKFSSDVLDFLFLNASSKKFNRYYFNKFPYQYKEKFLYSKSTSELMDILNGDNNIFSNIERDLFLNKYFKRHLKEIE